MSQIWEVTGIIEVEERATVRDALGRPVARRRPLAGITVEVAGWPDERGAFAVWGQTSTDADGRFRVRERRPSWAQVIRLSTRFAGEQLVVTEEATDGVLRRDWIQIAETPDAVAGPVVDLGARTFREGGPGVLGADDIVRRATTWYLVRSAMEFLAALGAGVGFTQRIAVVYPASELGRTSGVRAGERSARIHRDDSRDEWSVGPRPRPADAPLVAAAGGPDRALAPAAAGR
jgi:hypothetical protein